MTRLAALVLTLLIAAPAFGQSLSDPATLNAPAPAVFKARFDTSKGTFVVEVHRDWAPNGADRFYNLVKNGFFNNARFFRVISGFMVQFGINADPKISAHWEDANIPDDRVISGMQVVTALYSGYGEGAPQGQGPEQGLIQSQGNAYLIKQFPKLDFIKKATIAP